MFSTIETFGTPWWFFLFDRGPLFLLGAIWFVVATTLALRGTDVDKPNRMAQLYGYTVCLITLVVSLVSISSMLDAAFDRANPLQSEFGMSASLTSFEAYKATYKINRPPWQRDADAGPDTTSEATLRQQYDAVVADRVASTAYRTSKSLTTSGILLLISMGLFAFHWRWVRRLNGAQPAGAS